jgi:hypothetical protein
MGGSLVADITTFLKIFKGFNTPNPVPASPLDPSVKNIAGDSNLDDRDATRLGTTVW